MLLPDAALGSLITAVIAGLVVFVSTVLTKEQKTSEFRQMWIDELRKDVSQFISGATEVTALMREKAGDKQAQVNFASDNFELIQQLQSVEHRIILRLNPIEHKSLIELIVRFRGKMKAAYSGNNRVHDEEFLTRELLEATKTVLSTEWKRVKRGEPTFQIVKWLAIGIALILGIWLLHAYIVFKPSSDKEKEASSPAISPTQVFVDNHAQISSCSTPEIPRTDHSSNVSSHLPTHRNVATRICGPSK